jgi:hypothetical protein
MILNEICIRGEKQFQINYAFREENDIKWNMLSEKKNDIKLNMHLRRRRRKMLWSEIHLCGSGF